MAITFFLILKHVWQGINGSTHFSPVNQIHNFLAITEMIRKASDELDKEGVVYTNDHNVAGGINRVSGFYYFLLSCNSIELSKLDILNKL